MSILSRTWADARRGLDGYRLALLAAIALYVWTFTRLAWQLHAGMRTHKADLGQIDQAIWNSSRGRFVEMTDNGYIATRMSDHVEPILALISPIYWVWNDTRAILLLQVLFIAVGAWLLYELTLTLFDHMLPPAQRGHIWQVEPLREHARPLGLALAAAYLLAPPLQSALLTEFHAAPLAVPLILWALLSVERRRWPQFIIAALLTALVKEEMALLAAGLGIWAIWREVRLKIEDRRVKSEDQRLKIGESRPAAYAQQSTINNRQATSNNSLFPALLVGAFITLFSLAWFYLATFVIVPAHAAEVYGVAESGYFARYGALGDSPTDIFTSFFTQPATVWAIATEPARLAYVFNLLMLFGFLSLLGPEILILALPVFLANLLSAYPAQYYGEFHYTAPLIPYVAAAAAFGVSRLWRLLARRTTRASGAFQHLPAAGAGTMAAAAFFTNARTAIRPLLTGGLTLWIVGWAIFGYAQAGRGPLGGRYDFTPVTAHHRLLPRFVAQIPRDAAVTATAAVHPHVSHRRYVYQFPMGLEAVDRQLGNAEWALLDVTTNTDMAPGDLFARVQAMLAGEWGVIDGADGFLLLQKGAPAKTIPDAFHDFARAPVEAEAASPAPLHFAGVRADDWPRWRQTKVIAQWDVGPGFDPAVDVPRLEIRTPAGETLYTSADLTPPALLWYPPARWQPGDSILVTTLPLYLPSNWGVAVSHGDATLLPLRTSDDLVLAATYTRRSDGTLLETEGARGAAAWFPAASQTSARTIRFEDANQPLTLDAQVAHGPYAPGAVIDVGLRWHGQGWPAALTAFVHLRHADGRQIQNDGLPRYFVDYNADAQLARHGVARDWRQLLLPPDAAPGERWEVVVGLYDPRTGERAAIVDHAGAPIGSEAVIGTIEVGAPRTPDQACALIPATCASQPR